MFVPRACILSAVAVFLVSVPAFGQTFPGPSAWERPSALQTVGRKAKAAREAGTLPSEPQRATNSYPSGYRAGDRPFRIETRSTDLRPRSPRPRVTRETTPTPDAGVQPVPTTVPHPLGGSRLVSDPAPRRLPQPRPLWPISQPAAVDESSSAGSVDEPVPANTDRVVEPNPLLEDAPLDSIRATLGGDEEAAMPDDVSFGPPVLDNPDRVLDWMRDCPGPANYVFCHNPLYFEDGNLERLGFGRNRFVQPFSSAAMFYGSIAILPYKMGVDLPWSCVRAKAFPGPCRRYPWHENALPPWSWRGAAFQVAAVSGLVFVVP